MYITYPYMYVQYNVCSSLKSAPRDKKISIFIHTYIHINFPRTKCTSAFLSYLCTSDRTYVEYYVCHIIIPISKCNIKSTNPANQNTPSSPLLPSLILPSPSLASEKPTKLTFNLFFFQSTH